MCNEYTCFSNCKALRASMRDKRYISAIIIIIILLYNRSSYFSDVNAARKGLFMHKNLQFDYLPPSKEALIQHIMRASYQGGVIWGQSLEQNMKVLPPDMWGWVKTDENMLP